MNDADLTQATRTRRLLLAKQLYAHGLDHSRLGGALDKMIAVHNFHNAIETTLRGIFLEHDIRTERELNIDFEALLKEIDEHGPFRNGGKRLPYRRELRTLNAMRNLVQHHGHEPETAAMDEWRVFTRRFLEKAFKLYFGVDFGELSAASLLQEVRFRKLLARRADLATAGALTDAVAIDKLIFAYAAASLHNQLPAGKSSWAFFTRGQVRELGLERLVQSIQARVADAEFFAVLLASGTRPADVVRAASLQVSASIAIDGQPILSGSQEVTQEDADWHVDYVVQTLLRLQNAGLRPDVAERHQTGCDAFLAGT